MMKKLLAIIVLGLLWCNVSFSASGLEGVYKECFIKEITLPKLKVYERTSFSEMKDFPDPKNILEYKNKFYLKDVNLLISESNAFKEIRFEAINSIVPSSRFKIVLEDKNKSIVIQDYLYAVDINAEEYVKYKRKYGLPVVAHIKDDILELKSRVMLYDTLYLKYDGTLGDYRPKDDFSIFLKCKFETYNVFNKKKKNKRNKIISSYEYYLIILGIISLINFGGIVYLIRKKK